MSAHSTKKDSPGHGKIAPGLYLAATPVGNLGDITLRALETLKGADAVLCEDTRVSGKLLAHFGIKKPLISYNDHNAGQKRAGILKKLEEGEALVLISDAGMPLISDPGFKLVRECLERGFNVTSLPGANAPLPALQLSGLPADKFCFLGFLPPKKAAREKLLAEWKDAPATLIAFETAPRLTECLRSVRAVLGGRDAAVARELTKLYEEVRRGPVSELIPYYEEAGPPRGEIVLVIGPGEKKIYSDKEIRALLEKALETSGTKEAAREVAEQTGRPRKEIYDLALEVSKHGADG